jgi:hypothetical protein
VRHGSLRAVGLTLLLGIAACGGERREASSAPPSSATPDAGGAASALPERAPIAAPPGAPEAPFPDCRMCFGKITAGLQAELTRRARQMMPCYDQALVRNANARGRLTVRIRVGQRGSLCSAKVTHDEIGDDELATCARTAFEAEGVPLPAPADGCIDVNVPLNFVPIDAGTSDAAR